MAQLAEPAPAETVEEILSLREQLSAEGHDCGAQTIAHHLAHRSEVPQHDLPPVLGLAGFPNR